MKITKKANGDYTIRLRIKVNGEWKEKRLTDSDKDNLIYRASKLKKETKLEDFSTKKWKMGEFYELFMSTYKDNKVSRSTEILYELAYEQFIDFFGDILLDSIDAVKYQRFINYLGEDYALATVDTRHRKIRAIYNKAVELGYARKNPTKGAVMSGEDVSKNKKMFMETDKVELLVQELQKKNSTSRGVILLAIRTGMRFEEIIALTNKDINFKNQTIEVTKAWDYKFTNNFIDTKTKKSRTIFMDTLTSKMVKEYTKWHSANVDNSNNTLDLLFNRTGTRRPISNNGVNKELKKLCKLIESDELTLHKLRHTHTGLCVEAGMDIIYVADRLGHEDINTTLKYYSHLSESLKNNNKSKLDSFFAAKS